ncbi:hypothetical protein [Streptomyces parvulus]|uniref:hypothetical protein n=1 Tax=Streptomyces parvulus TaxID=146923 RepID=UPI0033A467D2
MSAPPETGRVAADDVAKVLTRQNTPAERAAASRIVQRHARSQEDSQELLDALGLTETTPAAPCKQASVPNPTTTDVPINTRRDA